MAEQRTGPGQKTRRKNDAIAPSLREVHAMPDEAIETHNRGTHSFTCGALVSAL